MTIGTRIFLSFIILIALCAGVVIYFTAEMALTGTNNNLMSSYDSLSAEVLKIRKLSEIRTAVYKSGKERGFKVPAKELTGYGYRIYNTALAIHDSGPDQITADLLEDIMKVEKKMYDKKTFRPESGIYVTKKAEDILTHSKEKFTAVHNSNNESVRRGMTAGFISLFCLIAAAVFFSYFNSRTIIGPLRRVAASAQLIGKGQFGESAGTDIYSTDEIGELAASIDTMRLQLREYEKKLLKAQRASAVGEIVNSVNHEINNPLMILTGNIEILYSERTRMSDEQKAALDSVKEEAARITEIVQKLREIDLENLAVLNYLGERGKYINIHKTDGGEA
ncbi:MAG: HAMP domain-containing protein [Fibrobacterota bacterium]